MIRSELTGSESASACGITVHVSSPVIALCKALVAAGHDPAEPMEAYRGAALALRVRAIGEAAGLKVTAEAAGFIRAAPSMRKSGQAATPLADED